MWWWICAREGGTNNPNGNLEASSKAPRNEGLRKDLRAFSNLRALVEILLDLIFLPQALKFGFKVLSRESAGIALIF
jgi:hypothetical protein